jgi:hypothetical protein
MVLGQDFVSITSFMRYSLQFFSLHTSILKMETAEVLVST